MRADDASFEFDDEAPACVGHDANDLVRVGASRSATVKKLALIALDNLPDIPGICEAELDVIERYMSDILDEVLSGGK